MKFGVFLPSASNGFVISKGAPLYLPSFQHNLDTTLEAERQGFSFALAMMKWKGFGGETGYWDGCLETFSLMAGMASRTSSIARTTRWCNDASAGRAMTSARPVLNPTPPSAEYQAVRAKSKPPGRAGAAGGDNVALTATAMPGLRSGLATSVRTRTR